MANIAVVGGGPMGLATAYHLLKQGHQVTLFEADKTLGGMSASFVFDGIKIERYYHFICKSDDPLFALLAELGIENTLRWTQTRMGYYYQGALRNWGDPVALLKFPGLSLISKIRYGLLAFISTKRSDWTKLDNVDAVTWLKRWVGQSAYDILWRPLFELKFYHYTSNLSAAWIWSRLKRVGTSRKNLLQEELGYLQGGSDTFLDAIAARIESLGGAVHLNEAVQEVLLENGELRGVRTQAGNFEFDRVVSTIPMPYVSAMVPKLPPAILDKYDSVNNIAVVCVLVHLSEALTPYFWLNISDPDIDIPGFIEYSNLNPLDGHIVYAPFYIPGEHADYQKDDAFFVEKVRRYLFAVKPDLEESDILKIAAGRYRYAQPICEPEFLTRLPDINPGVEGLYIADTCFYYPQDRSISESVKLGRTLANMAGGQD
ncbi:Protoporphyrinogen oxidase [Halioglobus japonicus]|nr:Protoporphyrinogen oxidase [Halioglobus japonicus]